MTFYLDHNATTPLDPIVQQEMEIAMEGCFGNSSSAHRHGWDAEELVEESRLSVAKLVGVSPCEVFFTSGATEANNWFLKRFRIGLRSRLISSPIEHKSVLGSLNSLECPVHYLETVSYTHLTLPTKA